MTGRSTSRSGLPCGRQRSGRGVAESPSAFAGACARQARLAKEFTPVGMGAKAVLGRFGAAWYFRAGQRDEDCRNRFVTRRGS